MKRIVAHAWLGFGAVGSAALAGFLMGLLGLAVSGLSRFLGLGLDQRSAAILVFGLVALTIALDLTNLALGAPRPLTLGRQVPRQWGRLLPPAVTAFLYGARLGVGPLTILSTWTWWAVMIGAAVIGVWPAVLVSAVFALTRVVVNAAAARLSANDHVATFGALRLLERRGRSSLTGLAAALLATVILASACGSDDETARPALIDSAETPVAAADAGGGPQPTTPAELEDVVRTQAIEESTAEYDVEPIASADGATAGPSQPDDEVRTDGPAVDESTSSLVTDKSTPSTGLDQALPATLPGMVPIEAAEVDRFLTIDDAASIQPDPTEEIALLETRGYRGGWIRAFRSVSSDVAVASVYEFSDATEAEFYLEDGLITIGGYGGEFFEIPGLPGVRGFQQDTVDGRETVRTLGASFNSGIRWYLLYLVGAPSTVTPEALIPAVTEIHAAATTEPTGS